MATSPHTSRAISLTFAISQSPMLRAVLQGITISAIANIIAQLLKGYRNGGPVSFDPGLFCRFLAICVIMSPMNYCWQASLEHVFPGKLPTKGSTASDVQVSSALQRDSADSELHLLAEDGIEDEASHQENTLQSEPKSDHSPWQKQDFRKYIRNTMLKLVVDCFLIGTWWNISFFLFLNGLLRFKRISEVLLSVKIETVPIVLNSFKVWPFAIFLGLTLFPMEKRIVFYSSVNFFWAIYMSLVAGREPSRHNHVFGMPANSSSIAAEF